MSTTEATGRRYTPRKPLSDQDEARLAAVSERFPKSKEAVAYGRKLLKVEAGLRSTPPPQGGLSSEEIATIREMLGIQA